MCISTDNFVFNENSTAVAYLPICCGELDLALSGEWTNDIPESGDRHSESRRPDTNDFLLSGENTSPNSSPKLKAEPAFCITRVFELYYNNSCDPKITILSNYNQLSSLLDMISTVYNFISRTCKHFKFCRDFWKNISPQYRSFS